MLVQSDDKAKYLRKADAMIRFYNRLNKPHTDPDIREIGEFVFVSYNANMSYKWRNIIQRIKARLYGAKIDTWPRIVVSRRGNKVCEIAIKDTLDPTFEELMSSGV